MITLIHPSRGRAAKAKVTYNHWMLAMRGTDYVQHILSIDRDDEERELYNKYFGDTSTIISTGNSCVVEATNIAALVSKGDILIYMSDDFTPPDGWDVSLQKFAEEYAGQPWLLKVDDCLQPMHVKVLTIPIMSRALYAKLGYFWHPGYRSMFVDEDLYHTTVLHGRLIIDGTLKFPHAHCCNGNADNDDTYKRSAANWEQGKALFAHRKSLNFPLENIKQ